MAERTARSPRGRGFTLVEVLLGMVVAGVVLASAYALVLSGGRLYTHMREAGSASEGLRAAASVLTSDLRPLSSDGDLYTIEADSISIRSLYASGVVCSHESGNWFGLQEVSGEMQATAEDTAMVWVRETAAYYRTGISDARNGAAAAQAKTPVCFWADSTTSVPRPQAAVKLAGAPSVGEIEVGADLHAFRRTTYLLVQDDGRWWLGRRVGTGSEEVLAGPLVSPAEGGLAFTYLDATGTVTADPAAVRRIDVTLRSESLGRSNFGSDISTVRDSVSLSVHLRNDGP